MTSSVTFLTWRSLSLIIFLTIGVEQSLYVKLFIGGKNSPQFKSVCVNDIPDDEIMSKLEVLCIKHWVKSDRIWTFSGLHFPWFGLNTGISCKSQNRCYKKTKHAKFSEKRTHVKKWVSNVRFSKNLVRFVFLQHPLWNSFSLPYYRRVLR